MIIIYSLLLTFIDQVY